MLLQNLSIANSTQVASGESPISVESGRTSKGQGSTESSPLKFSVRPEIPEQDPGVQTVDLVGDLTPPFGNEEQPGEEEDEKAFTPIRAMPSVEKE